MGVKSVKRFSTTSCKDGPYATPVTAQGSQVEDSFGGAGEKIQDAKKEKTKTAAKTPAEIRSKQEIWIPITQMEKMKNFVKIKK